MGIFTPDLALIGRFLIALLALSLSYMAVLSLVFNFEGGLFHENHIPMTVSPAMRRARSFFLKAIFGVLGVSYLLAYGLTFVMPHIVWMSYVWPAVGGVSFGMLYGGVTRFDRIRPREGK